MRLFAPFLVRSPFVWSARAAVESLLSSGCPTPVGRLVITIVVDAIKRKMRCWTVANISKKVIECVPTLAHFDATSAPVSKSWMGWIIAAGKHVHPDVIERLSFATAHVAVPVSASVMAARFGSLKAVKADVCYRAASALAEPILSPLGIFVDRLDRYALAKSSACEVGGGGYVCH